MPEIPRSQLVAYVALALVIGVTRVYLGVHYPTDVLAGWSAGLAWALLWWLVAELPEARLVLQGDFSFEPGIDVTDVDNAKGLEFDYVVVPDGTAAAYPKTDEARRRLHVAVTRASHQLWIVAGAAASPLITL